MAKIFPTFENTTKRQVWETYKKVKANKGSSGVDRVDFEESKVSGDANYYPLHCCLIKLKEH